MAQCRQEFALVGYSENLESRPLRFVDPIPASRICSACGNIPRLTYTPVCGHTFCEACYQSCATTSECVCPLDGDVCGRDDVSRKEYPAEQLLRREVHCWNEANGCGVILPASQIAEHARRDCKHHVSRCPTCSADVLSRDVCAHLKSRCATLVLHTAPEAARETEIKGNVHFVALEKQVEQRTRDLEARLAKLSLVNGSHKDKLLEVCHNIISLTEVQAQVFEALAEKFERASAATMDRLDRNEAEIQALATHGKSLHERVAQLFLYSRSQSDTLVDVSVDLKHIKESLTQQFGPPSEIKVLSTEKSEPLMSTIGSVLASVPSDVKMHQWVLDGYASLKEKAEKEGSFSRMTDTVYLRRYLMSWGISFVKEDDGLYIALCIQLYKGKEDEFLDWPFTKLLRLSIIHPETQQQLQRDVLPPFDDYYKFYFLKPKCYSNKLITLPDSKIKTRDIERGGYVKGNQLILRLDVLL